MTLVEVIVSMVIFCLVSVCILTAFTAAIQATNRTKMRDVEVAEQANALEKKDQKDGVKQNGGTYKITFSKQDGTEVSSVSGVNLFTTDASTHSSTFEFMNIKSFGTGGFDGNETIADPTNHEYKIIVNNQTSGDINYTFKINDDSDRAYVYEGKSTSGYKCSSKIYTRSVAAGSDRTFGYFDLDDAADHPSMSFTDANNNFLGSLRIDDLELQKCLTTHVVTITINSSSPCTVNFA